MDDYKSLSSLLHDYLRKNGKTGADLARALEVSPSTVSRWLDETVAQAISLDHIFKLVKYLGLTDDERDLLLRKAGHSYVLDQLRRNSSKDDYIQDVYVSFSHDIDSVVITNPGRGKRLVLQWIAVPVVLLVAAVALWLATDSSHIETLRRYFESIVGPTPTMELVSTLTPIATVATPTSEVSVLELTPVLIDTATPTWTMTPVATPTLNNTEAASIRSTEIAVAVRQTLAAITPTVLAVTADTQASQAISATLTITMGEFSQTEASVATKTPTLAPTLTATPAMVLAEQDMIGTWSTQWIVNGRSEPLIVRIVNMVIGEEAGSLGYVYAAATQCRIDISYVGYDGEYYSFNGKSGLGVAIQDRRINTCGNAARINYKIGVEDDEIVLKQFEGSREFSTTRLTNNTNTSSEELFDASLLVGEWETTWSTKGFDELLVIIIDHVEPAKLAGTMGYLYKYQDGFQCRIDISYAGSGRNSYIFFGRGGNYSTIRGQSISTCGNANTIWYKISQDRDGNFVLVQLENSGGEFSSTVMTPAQ